MQTLPSGTNGITQLKVLEACVIFKEKNVQRKIVYKSETPRRGTLGMFGWGGDAETSKPVHLPPKTTPSPPPFFFQDKTIRNSVMQKIQSRIYEQKAKSDVII